MIKAICIENDFAYISNGHTKIKLFIKKGEEFLIEYYNENSQSLTYNVYTLDGYFISVFSRNTFLNLAEFREKRINEILDEI